MTIISPNKSLNVLKSNIVIFFSVNSVNHRKLNDVIFTVFLNLPTVTVYRLKALTQTWNLGGLVQRLVKVLPVEIWSWNSAHTLRRPNEALGIFFGSGSFLMATQGGSKETLWSVGSERLERDGKLKFCRELHWSISGPRNFIQHNWSIGWASNFIFPGTSLEFTNFLDSPTNDIL